ncbi:GspH/FimT family pseudopilin [Acinetobacter sp. Tr-809]|uniref:GspH/FimT family pseudopilin n=1 Tax=Acinetobacter sp. Tr-809 TaxID=2608324 RepID=UPI001C087829|nr:GspH/FimT family pseudopilin [Acinetobacter sp. Tr-809]
MQQAHDDLQSCAQKEHSFTDSSTRSIASRLAVVASTAQHHPFNFGHSSSSCAQTKPSFVHLRSGFTLVELIITIAVFAIIALLAAPSFATMYSRQKLESSARELVMKISEARSQAVLLRESTGVCLASLSDDDCATAIAIPKTETQRIFIARLDYGVTSANSSSTNLSFRRNGSLAAQKDFILHRQNLSYCIQVGVIGDTTIKEGACT